MNVLKIVAAIAVVIGGIAAANAVATPDAPAPVVEQRQTGPAVQQPLRRTDGAEPCPVGGSVVASRAGQAVAFGN